MRFFLLVIMCVVFYVNGRSQGVLGQDSAKHLLTDHLISQKNYHPFPKIEDREGWRKANQQLLQKNLEDANELLDYVWESIPATYALLPSRTGNRGPYGEILNRKRGNLWKLAMAEVYENKGRFLDQIVNGIWSICEDSYWGHTVHLNLWRSGPGLPDVKDPFVDIYASEVASTLSWVSYFLNDKLDSISPLVTQRIYHEINQRIFEPVMKHLHYWMGPSEYEKRPNNWNPWICANWLNAALLLEQNDERRKEMVTRIIEILDEFFVPFPNDGCSDEGPNYWKGAAGTFFEAVSILHTATNGAIDIYANEKFKNMGRYIWRVAIDPVYAVNFSDCKPVLKVDGSVIYRYGVRIDDPGMIQMGAGILKKQGVNMANSHLFNELSELFLGDEYLNVDGKLPLPKEYFFPNTEVFVARDTEGSSNGFFVAAKGGNNHESHNHNDLGSYIIYYDGKPVIVDPGSGTYTARTFSDKRYDIWFNGSEYHNTPTINGVNQLPGDEFYAIDVKHSCGENSSFSMDLVKAYPEISGIKRWKREITLNRGKFIEVSNQFKLSEVTGTICENIMTALEPRLTKENKIELVNKSNGAPHFFIEFNPEKLKVKIEKINYSEPEDRGIKKSWGDNLYRIRLELIGMKKKNDYKIRYCTVE